MIIPDQKPALKIPSITEHPVICRRINAIRGICIAFFILLFLLYNKIKVGWFAGSFKKSLSMRYFVMLTIGNILNIVPNYRFFLSSE